MPNVTKGDLDPLYQAMAKIGDFSNHRGDELPKAIRDRYNGAISELVAVLQELEDIAAGTWQAERIDGRCSWCLDPMVIPDRYQGGGRTKRFCSSACRVAHHRWRNDPENAPDRQTWIINNRPGLHQE